MSESPGFELHRLGTIMEPQPGNPQEIEGALNPAASRARTGTSTYSRGSWPKGTTRALA